MKDQSKTPFLSKLTEYVKKDTVPFDVPGHKRGTVSTDFSDLLGISIFEYDSNAPRGLDNLNHPKGVIKEAEELAAEAFGADRAYFLTGGTTSGILAMIMSTCKAKQKIIMPRNVHKSIINGLILSGGIPIFIKPDMDKDLGIANGVDFEKYKEVIDNNQDAVAVFIINPTYFGVVNDLKKIIDYAHSKNMLVIADEAHGGNLYFSEKLPLSIIEAGGDLSAVSMHKTLGSLTQSSILLSKGDRVDHQRLRATLNIIQSTSPSQLLIASIDAARKMVFYEANTKINNVIKWGYEAIIELNKIKGIEAFGRDYFIENGAFDFDESKLIIKVSDLGMTGFEVYKILADNYDIQMELAENKMLLGILSFGTTKEHLNRLVSAIRDISGKHYGIKKPIDSKSIYTYPESYTRPREAYHAPHKIIPVSESLGEIASESVMAYPPGIPLVIPGEIITLEIINALKEYELSDSTILSDCNKGFIKVIDKEEWIKWEDNIDEI